MKRLFLFILLLAAASGLAVTTNERVTLTITVTEMAETGDSWTFQGYLRNWTNSSSSGEILTNLSASGTAGATTNLADNIAEYPYAGGPWLFRWSASNIVQIVGPLGTAIAASQIGDWCTFGLTTQKIAITKTMLYPMTGLIQSNAVDQATETVTGINTYSTNAFATNAVAMRNYLRRTNDYATNTVLDGPTFTNAANYGNPFRSPGGGTGSEQIGSGASASTNYATALGFGTKATNLYATAIGAYAIAQSNSAVAVGYAATAANNDAIAIGTGTAASGFRSIAIGSGAESAFMNAIAVGTSVTTARSNTIVLGGSQDVIIGGRLDVVGELTNNSANITGGTVSNVTLSASAATFTTQTSQGGYDTNRLYDRGFSTNHSFNGTTTFKTGAAAAFTRSDISTLADGANYAVPVGSNVFVKLTGTLSAAGNIYGIVGAGTSGGANGQWIVGVNATGQIVTFENDSGDPVAANRILTPNAGTITVSNLYSFQLIYDAGSSRWRVLEFCR